MSTGVLEIVTFRTGEAAEADVLAAMPPFEALLARQDGFLARRLGRAAGGEWLVCVEWRDLLAAESAARALETAPEAGAFFRFVEPKSVGLRYFPVLRDFRLSA